ncbi:putative ATP-utilizing enzyme (ATP-grasp superfamily) [Cylindrospermum stagnale PCC 7417]|uniref:Putative ATP-utilizing enzyme (ATP-grasp superfamily) n=1 Tax=Cylindrospermum stagnale PCC 7417 TaxID=56107 RepID=K9X1C6_9NOST|nr:ATP-grasp domain-containing protein [Cylindrospermum stagnale]AFZ26283.1 putative ATP-utilizing enzyme (ATP-grasp superfamily) [Cylindrospermum stagnale PCC 7417]
MKTKQPAILIPDSCNNPLAYYVIRCLKEANSKFKINVIVSANQESNEKEWLVFYKYSAYIDQLFFSENLMNSVEYLDEVVQIIENKEIDIILPASEDGFKFVAKFRKKLSTFCKVIALPSNDALDTAFDKWKLHIFLKKNNIPTPETYLLKEIEQISKINWPVLIKPIDGSGGENIQKFDTLAPEIFQVILNHPSEVYIVQEYIHGYDMGCSVLCQDGQVLAYTIQQQLGLTEGFAPKIDKLKFVHDSAVIDIVTKTMNALKWSGVANLDLRYNSKTEEINIIEINPRFWQSLMGSLSVSVNFPYLLYLLSNGISFEYILYQEKYYAKFHRFIKDALNGSLEYSLSNTNIRYFLSDINALIYLLFYKIVKTRLFQKIINIFFDKLKNYKLLNDKRAPNFLKTKF